MASLLSPASARGPPRGLGGGGAMLRRHKGEEFWMSKRKRGRARSRSPPGQAAFETDLCINHRNWPLHQPSHRIEDYKRLALSETGVTQSIRMRFSVHTAVFCISFSGWLSRYGRTNRRPGLCYPAKDQRELAAECRRL